VNSWRVACGRLGKAGEQRPLREPELADTFPEIRPRGSLHPVRALPEVDLVQVQVQDFLLAHLPFHPVGQDQFLELAADALFGGEEEVLHRLLGYGAPSLGEAPPQEILDGGTNDRGEIDPPMVEEVGILGGDEGVHDMAGDLVKRGKGPFLDVEFPYHVVIAVVDLGGYARPVLLHGIEGGKRSELRQEDETGSRAQEKTQEEGGRQEKRSSPGAAPRIVVKRENLGCHSCSAGSFMVY